MVKSFFSGVLIFFCLVVAEAAIFSNISFLPAIPDFVLLCAVYLAFLNGRSYGVVLGFVSGMLLDFITGCPFGFNCLLRTIIGYLAGFLFGTVNFRGVFMPVVIGCVCTLLKFFFTWFISLFYPNYVVTYSFFSISFIFELIINSVLCPAVFKIFSCFDKYTALNQGAIK